ncbi:Spermatophylax protein 13, partial [Gryllus bimaculatus]
LRTPPTSERDKARLFEFFDHPDFKTYIHGFSIRPYLKRGPLLKDLLWHLVAEYRTQPLDPDTFQLILNVRDHVMLSGAGALPVEKAFVCNTTGSPIDDKPKPILPALTPCVGTATDVHSKIDVLTLLTALKDRVPLYIVTAFMQHILNTSMENDLQDFEIIAYETRGQLLTGILGYIANKTHVADETRETLLKMREYVLQDGPGAVRFTVHPCEDPIEYPQNGTGPILMQNDGKICENSTDAASSAGYKLHLSSLLSVIRGSAPRRYLVQTLAFLSRPASASSLTRNVDVLDFSSRGPLFKELLTVIATKPNVERTVRRAATALIPYIYLNGPGRLPLILLTSCSEDEQLAEPAETAQPQSGVCAQLPNGEAASLVDMEALIRVFDSEAPLVHKARFFGFLSQTNVHELLKNVDIDSYITKAELIQDILVELWMNTSYGADLSEAAKKLLPFVSFDGIGGLPPKRTEVCFNPDTKEILVPPYPQPMEWKFEFVSDKECSYLDLSIHATKVYSFDLDSVFLAFQQTAKAEEIAVLKNYLLQPSASAHLQGLDLEKQVTRGQLLENIVTLVKFSRFSGGRMPPDVKDALKHLARRINANGPAARAPVAVSSRCRPQAKGAAPLLNLLIAILPEDDRNPSVTKALNDIFEALLSKKVSLYDVLPALDPNQPLSRYQLLRIVLERLRKIQSLKLDFEISLVLMHISEKTSDSELPKLADAESKSNNTIVDIDYIELIKVFKSEAPTEEVSMLESFMKSPEFKESMKDFNATSYIRQGELLLAMLEYLKALVRPDLKIAIDILIPYIDFEDLGALPPTIHKVHVKTRTQVSIITLDFGLLFRSIPRKKLTPQGKVALDAIFKYLSSPTVDFKELFRGINPQQSTRVQLKILLLKIKQMAGEEISGHAAHLLDILSNEMDDTATYNPVALPNLDWIEILHAVPETKVPPEVLNAKRDLYTFFISKSFKNVAHNYIADISETRARFLKDLLFFLRGKPELKMVKSSIAYVMPFIKEKDLGEVVISDDIISPRDEEEGKIGQNRVKELLYQVLGMVEQRGSLDVVQSLQKIFKETQVQIGSTFIGWDVLEDFPQKERIIIILKRIRNNFGLFLGADTMAAITMVLEQLGQNVDEMDSHLSTDLPVDLETLLANVLNNKTPPEIRNAMNLTLTYYNENKFLLGRAFEGMVDSMKRLNKTSQLSVVLRVFWKLQNREKDALDLHPSNKTYVDQNLDALKKLYKYINPHKKGIDVGSQEHYTTIITTLNTLVSPNAEPEVLKAKNVIEDHMNQHEHIYDEALARLVSLNLTPKDLVARALRRYREHQSEMAPDLWAAVSTIFDYLGVEEHDSTEDETDNNFQIVDEFKDLLDEAGHGAGRSRQIVLKFMVDHKDEITRIFKGHRTLFKYPSRDKMALLLGRLLRFFRHKLDLPVITAIGDILRRLEVTGESMEEVFLEESDVFKLLEDAVDEDADDSVQDAKDVIEHFFQTNPNKTEDVLTGVIIRENFGTFRRLAAILRRLQRKYRLSLNSEEKEALKVLFRYLEVDENSSVEDQFAGTYNFNSLFMKVFPNDTEPEILEASQRMQDLLAEANVKYVLRGLNLWKLTEETQVGLILYRMHKYMNLSAADNATLMSLLDNLDYELMELASDDRDETFKPEESLSDGEIDPYTFDFAGTFSKAVPSFAPTLAQHAKQVVVAALRARPGAFKKPLEGVRALDSEDEVATALKV